MTRDGWPQNAPVAIRDNYLVFHDAGGFVIHLVKDPPLPFGDREEPLWAYDKASYKACVAEAVLIRDALDCLKRHGLR